MIGPTCPKCQRIHAEGDVQGIGLFSGKPIIFRTPDGTVHESREDAQAWLCEQRRSA